MSSYDERGWVAPVTGDGDGLMDPIEPSQRTIRSSIVAGIVVFALIAAAIAGTVVWRNRTGDPFASAHSVPADMDFVVTFDALALSDSARLQSFVDAFAVPMVDAGIIDDYPEDLVAAIDTAMAEEGDITLSGDILPWIGRSVSIAASVPELDPATFEVDGLSFLLSADVRNHDAAAAFVAKALDAMAGSDVKPTATTIGGLPGYAWHDDLDEISIGLVLTDDTLLVGVEQDVADAIAANDAGLSIADDASFTDVMSRLPNDRMVSFYMGKSAFADFLGMAEAASMGESSTPADLLVSMGASVTLVDEGMLFSYVVTGNDQTPTSISPDRDVVAALPGDTLGFLSIAGSDSSDGAIDESALGDLSDLFDQLYYETGVDVAALLQSMSGDLTVAATETRDGLIASESDVPVGIVGAIGLLDSGPVTDLIANLEEMMRQSGVDLEQDGNVTTVSDTGQEIISYSVGPDLLVVGTGHDIVSSVVSGAQGGLLSSDLYQELDGAVIGDGLVGYVDIAGIVDLVPMTREEAAVVAPVRGLGVGSESDGTAQLVELLVLIDY